MGLFSSDAEEIEVTLVGSVPRDRGLTVAAAIEDHFEATVTVGERLSTFETLHGLDGEFSPGRDAYDAERDQYDGIEFLRWKPYQDERPHVWLTDVDLYHSEEVHRRYVFGSAVVDGGSCIVSTYRLADDEDAWDEVAEQRLRKEALKQVGRALGAEGCDDEACALCPAAIPEDLDRIQESICEDCAEAIGPELLR